MREKLKSCETCNNFEFDDEAGDYICVMEMDEDDIYRLSDRESRGCPFYSFSSGVRVQDDYSIVRKQN